MNAFVQAVYIDGGILKMMIAEFIRGIAWSMGALLVFSIIILLCYKFRNWIQ